jgi:hypothetical protein
MKVRILGALISLGLSWQAQAGPAADAVFSATDDAKVQTLSPQDQEQLRQALAEAQGQGVSPQAVWVLQQPRFRGSRIDWCLTWSSNCGDPAATVACKLAGFRRAAPGAYAYTITSPTIVLGSDQVCTGACGALAWIGCEFP